MLPLTFKIATEQQEFDQIYQLNYHTFVEEIPQHQPNPDLRLVDKFHEQNTYIICLCDQQLIGMIAVRGERPFSLDAKLPNLDDYLPKGRSVCEIRLLAIKPNYRKGMVFRGLLEKVVEYCLARGYDLAIISGTVRQLKLYRHLGFVPFGPLVGSAQALYQPMSLTLEDFRRKIPWILTSSPYIRLPKTKTLDLGQTSQSAQTATPTQGQTARSQAAKGAVNLLPGPVDIHPEVQKAFCRTPISHRSRRFAKQLAETKQRLCELVKAERAEIFLGSGTLANDVIGAQLSLQPGSGVILSNGEFGERLVDHAIRFGLRFSVLRAEWGSPLDYELLEELLQKESQITWLWCVHCETSTGVLNDLARISSLGQRHNLLVCADCISSIGTVEVDLRNIYLASGVSGKGLGALPGLSIVFSNQKEPPAPSKLPRYLDLGYYALKNGLPFTSSSNLLAALEAAVKRLEPKERLCRIRELGGWLRNELRACGLKIVAADEESAPAIISIALPGHIDSELMGQRLEEEGYLLSYGSDYLLERNWIQICLMSEYSQDELASLPQLLARLIKELGKEKE